MPSGMITTTRPTIGFAFETLPVSNSAVGLTASTFQPSSAERAEHAFITCEGEVRYRYDGTNPTSTVGHILQDGAFLIVKGEHQLNNIKFIRVSADSTLQITYERE